MIGVRPHPLTRIAVCQEGTDGQQDLGDGKGRAPIVLQDVQADDALTVDVAVIDPGAERDLRTKCVTGDGLGSLRNPAEGYFH